MSTRRDLLRLAGLAGVAGLAGCLSSAEQPTPTPTPDDGELPAPGAGGSEPSQLETPPGATHRVSVTAQDDAPDLPVRPRVELADPYATPGSPPVLKVTVENPTDEAVTIGEYRGVVFQYVVSDDQTFILLPHSERSTEGEPDRTTPDYDVAGDGCWRLTDGTGITAEYGTVEVPAKGELVAFVGLYAAPDASACLPTGEHRFGATYSYFPDGMDGEPERDDWGFSLSVEEL
jgi:hypothetical protein